MLIIKKSKVTSSQDSKKGKGRIVAAESYCRVKQGQCKKTEESCCKKWNGGNWDGREDNVELSEEKVN